jgi:hypothetical protein
MSVGYQRQGGQAALYKYLGAHRHEIRAYASTVAYPTIDGYVDTLRAAVAEGFTAAKVHPFGEAARDIELAKALREEFPHIDLMIDPVCAYTVPDALAVGRVLDDLNFYGLRIQSRIRISTGLRSWRASSLRHCRSESRTSRASPLFTAI